MSTISPLKASITAQKRSLRDSTAAKYTTAIPQRTLDYESPNPNEEADPAPRESTGLKTKL